MRATTLAPARPATAGASASGRTAPAPIPFRRILSVELRKMFDTRSGFWLMASIVILSVIATGATLIFADRENLDFEAFASAVGIPMSVLLPMIGRSEEHTSELQSLMRISYAVFCLKKKKQ